MPREWICRASDCPPGLLNAHGHACRHGSCSVQNKGGHLSAATVHSCEKRCCAGCWGTGSAGAGSCGRRTSVSSSGNGVNPSTNLLSACFQAVLFAAGVTEAPVASWISRASYLHHGSRSSRGHVM